MTHDFYTDPLAAAWMAKHFGMRFTGQQAYVECTAASDGYQEWSGMETTVLSFVHADSLSLLEPREGDGVEFDRWHWERQRDASLKDAAYHPHLGRVLLFKNKRPDGGAWMQISSAGIGWDDNYGGSFALPFKIIQRDGKPFMWPEKAPESVDQLAPLKSTPCAP